MQVIERVYVDYALLLCPAKQQFQAGNAALDGNFLELTFFAQVSNKLTQVFLVQCNQIGFAFGVILKVFQIEGVGSERVFGQADGGTAMG